jgi:hypothetical protein
MMIHRFEGTGQLLESFCFVSVPVLVYLSGIWNYKIETLMNHLCRRPRQNNDKRNVFKSTAHVSQLQVVFNADPDQGLATNLEEEPLLRFFYLFFRIFYLFYLKPETGEKLSPLLLLPAIFYRRCRCNRPLIIDGVVVTGD